jgi:hypothetical protein
VIYLTAVAGLRTMVGMVHPNRTHRLAVIAGALPLSCRLLSFLLLGAFGGLHHNPPKHRTGAAGYRFCWSSATRWQPGR